MSTHSATIAGQTYTLFRPAADLPFAEVWVERADGTQWAVNTQYALYGGTVNARAFSGIRGASVDDLLTIAEAIVAEARAYLNGARDEVATDTTPDVVREIDTPAHVQALFATYLSAEAAWDAGDEAAWARMMGYAPESVAGGLAEERA